MSTNPAEAVPPRGAPARGTAGSGGGVWQGYGILIAVGVIVMSVAWCWFGFSFEEEMQEQPKALAAGTTMAGLGALLGGVPLVLAHVTGLIVLTIAARSAGRGLWFALIAASIGVTLASVIGIMPAQLLYSGELFNLGVNAPGLAAVG